jgi:hypothetical protein
MYLDRIFDLIDIVKNKFKKKAVEQELDNYLDSETPGAPKPYNNILKDRDIETIRKVGL